MKKNKEISSLWDHLGCIQADLPFQFSALFELSSGLERCKQDKGIKPDSQFIKDLQGVVNGIDYIRDKLSRMKHDVSFLAHASGLTLTYDQDLGMHKISRAAADDEEGITMQLFRELTKQEEAEYRQWARDNYVKFAPIKGVWHPVIQDECVKINSKHVGEGND